MELKQCIYLIFFTILMITENVICAEEETTKADEKNFAVELTDKTFDEAIKQNNYFVMFYAPWCGHCKRLHPLWEELAELMNVKEDPNLIIAKVDCTVERETCGKYEVAGYPTLNFLKVGAKAPVKFVGTRDMPALTEFINKQLRSDDENEISTDEEADGEKKVIKGKIVELTEDNFAKHVSSGNHFVKFYAPWCSHCQRLAPTWDQLAQTLKDNAVSVGKIDCTVYRPICQDFEVKGYPTLLWIEDGKKIEKYSGSRDHDALKTYVEKMLGNAAQQVPTPASDEEVDQKQKTEDDKDKSAVLQLTGEDFEKTIAKGVVFVKFYAPWCGHCQQLAPTWDTLAEKMHAAKNDVIIAKVDCTAAENKDLCVDQQVEGYPTLFAYKDGEKQTEYEGSRSLAELQQYITKFLGHDEL